MIHIVMLSLFQKHIVEVVCFFFSKFIISIAQFKCMCKNLIVCCHKYTFVTVLILLDPHNRRVLVAGFRPWSCVHTHTYVHAPNLNVLQ